MNNNYLKTTLLLMIAFCGSQAYSQTEGFGLKAGLNLSSFGGDANDSDTRIGLNFGGFYNQVLTGDFAVQPEASISLEGDDDVSFTNLNLGVMGKLNFEELAIEFGPQLGLILGDDDVNAEAVNLSIGFGAAYEFNSTIAAGLRYNAGLSNVIDQELVDITNNTLSINLFYGL